MCQLFEARQWVQLVSGFNMSWVWWATHSLSEPWLGSQCTLWHGKPRLVLSGFLLSTDRHSISPWPDPDCTPVCRLPSQYRQTLHITLTGPWLYTCVPATEFSDFVCFSFHFVLVIRPQTRCSVVYKTCLYSFQVTIFLLLLSRGISFPNVMILCVWQTVKVIEVISPSLSCYIVNQIHLLFLQLIYSYCYCSYYRLALLVYEMAQRGGGQEESQEVWAG